MANTMFLFDHILHVPTSSKTKFLALVALLLCADSSSYGISNSDVRKKSLSSPLKALAFDSTSRQGDTNVRTCANAVDSLLEKMTVKINKKKNSRKLNCSLSWFSAPGTPETQFSADKFGIRNLNRKRGQLKTKGVGRPSYKNIAGLMKPISVSINYDGTITASGISMLLILTLVGSNVLLQGEPSASFCWSAW
eukprot:CAMPEP_0194199570 /NCGR_PEP_ID=MMETSP0156-20130528/544_1 /TAXON_ID=33649 /ORGANISM="Thalassionema nitzschioides, Strain L26-B" /LENGTH=193 /DNA_ID=CAMNT_0038924487 /DNA_START=38 /DNA_END=616 /DNA_ORIENTATION=+